MRSRQIFFAAMEATEEKSKARKKAGDRKEAAKRGELPPVSPWREKVGEDAVGEVASKTVAGTKRSSSEAAEERQHRNERRTKTRKPTGAAVEK